MDHAKDLMKDSIIGLHLEEMIKFLEPLNFTRDEGERIYQIITVASKPSKQANGVAEINS